MDFSRKTGYTTMIAAVLLGSTFAHAQSPVSCGSGSYASMPPTYKAKTEPNGPGFNATRMLTRKIYADESASAESGGISVPLRPIPTNDWWTDIINSPFSGALWSYPAMLKTSATGVSIHYPSYWADAGKEMKNRSNLTVGGRNFRATSAIAKDWHDWDVVFRMPSASGSEEMKVTAAHGMPFTWFEFKTMSPEINLSDRSGELFGTGAGMTGVKIGDDLYAVYFPESVQCILRDGVISFDGETAWLSIALLRSESDLQNFADYATSVPRNTRVNWKYDEAKATVHTTWKVTAENLRHPGGSAPVLQGFLPHTYKYALPGARFNFGEVSYPTPRGEMKTGVAEDGEFSYSYRFSGMLPTYAAPQTGDAVAHGFNPEVLNSLMEDYASKGSFGGDTYWGGKGLLQMALNMTFAKQTGNTEVYETSRNRLKEAFVDWLTYTPGEDHYFFSYYPRWGAMLGFDVSYDSDAFNDHHFHYGYFTYAAALLCMEDKEFAAEYGEILTLIAKDYANWDHADNRFPFLRTLDPWNGHSWAGGLGDSGNDNGNGQESTSEAMQSWGGLYLLGVALDNKEMRDAGIWGWSTEARATREYWYDVDAPRPANEGGRLPWSGKGERKGNYRYDEYPYAYNSNITGKGIGWWTWFGGDPLFMHGIQWMPISPALDYLSWDPDFVGWAFDDMMRGANSSYSHDWFKQTTNTDNGDPIEPLAYNDWGNVALSYMQRNNPAEAARIFDEARDKKLHIATAVSTAHISYYVIHNHLTYGEPDFTCYSDIPTSQRYVKDGKETYVVYNNDDKDRTVHFYSQNGTLIKTVNAPARKLVAISQESVATEIECQVEGGQLIPPGDKTVVNARLLDQYGAGMTDKPVSMTLSTGAPATISGNTLLVKDDARRGDNFTLILAAEGITRTIVLTVNDRAKAQTSGIEGLPEMTEVNNTYMPKLVIEDQYSHKPEAADVVWTISRNNDAPVPVKGAITFGRAGNYTIEATSAEYAAKAQARVFVTPAMPLVSLGCEVAASSAENVGTLPSGACDGNLNERWGSNHTDDEWIVVDLGENAFMSKATLNWEAAFAARYLLETAPDGCQMIEKDVVYAGETHRISVPVESAWKTAADVHNTSPGERTTNINATGRYLRMKGLERGSAYGYSLYELSIYGIRSSLGKDEVVGVDFALPAVIDCGETLDLTPEAYTLGGEVIKGVKVDWNSNKAARFKGNTFTPEASGMHTLTATLGERTSTSATIFVNDIERVDSIALESKNYTLIHGEELYIPYTAINQFMAPYSGKVANIDIRITDSEGKEADGCSYDPATRIFSAANIGDYVIEFDGKAECKVCVRPVNEVNLALGKEAWASSKENDGLDAKFAVDGTLLTRWGSLFEDDQWMVVDLGKNYKIAKVLIYWNNPAYATDYSILLSKTPETESFVEAASVSNYHRTNEPAEHLISDIPARFVKVIGHKRSTGYGTSIDEIEVYSNEPSDDKPTTGIEVIDLGQESGIWYNLQGIRIPRPTSKGVYIRCHNKKSTKVVLP